MIQFLVHDIICDNFWLVSKYIAMLLGSKCLIIKRHHSQKLTVAEMHMLHWICTDARRDQVKNVDICDKIGVPSLERRCEKIAYDSLVMCDRHSNAQVQ